MIKYIDKLKRSDLDGKKVLLRVDFNVPVENGKIAGTFRVKAARETINYLIENGAKVILVAHISAVNSFIGIVEEIGEIIGHVLTLVPNSEIGAVDDLFRVCPIVMLDNVRQDEREEKNDKEFAEILAKGFDFYVNDAFAVSHRNQSSVSAITEFLPSYGGLLLKKEIENLSQAINTPVAGKTIVLGGAKISTKLPVIKNFIDKAENILIGGAIANDIFQSRGLKIGSSVVDDLATIDVESEKIILPDDILVTEDKSGKSGVITMPLGNVSESQMIVDIGPKSAERFSEIIKKSDMIVWNGPMGLSEVDVFANGTKAIAKAVSEAKQSIIGGGDTIAAADKLGLLEKYSSVSTGGGAMLEFLAGDKLPGLAALGYYSS